MTGRQLPPGLHGHGGLQIGDRFETASARVAPEAIDRFANLSGDRFALHMDDAAALELGFPARVAHGLLVLSLIDGLKNQSPVRLDAVASLGWDIRFSAPVFAGDAVQATFSVESMRPAREGRGIVVFAVKARNQRDEIVQHGTTTLMMRP